MGDTVLLQEEVNSPYIGGHRQMTGDRCLHITFFYEEPRIFYVHVHGTGRLLILLREYADTIRDSKVFPANQPRQAPATRQLQVKKISTFPTGA